MTSLRSFECTVVYTLGKREDISDILFRLPTFEQQEPLHALATLAAICREVPDNPGLYDATPNGSYRMSMDNTKNLQLAVCRQHENTSDTDVSITLTINKSKLKADQTGSGICALPYLTYLRSPGTRVLPPNETMKQ